MVREPRQRRLLSAVAIFLTALALQRACTLPWGSGSDGRLHFRLTVVGLSRTSDGSDGAITDCRWWPRYGDAALCAVRAEGRTMADRLRLAYPLLQVGLWLAVASLLLQALRVPRLRLAQASLPAVIAAGTLAAIMFVRQGATDGLAALQGITLQLDGTGFMAAVAALILATASAALLATTPMQERST